MMGHAAHEKPLRKTGLKIAGPVALTIAVPVVFLLLRSAGHSTQHQPALGSQEGELISTTAKEKRTPPTNVILIIIDTLRADHLSCYGYESIETPSIDRLAGEGVLFENCVSQAPLTLPSHCSILTGTNPTFHGVRDNASYSLRDEATTLAEVLKQNGFKTAAFVSSYILDSIYGLAQGFDVYSDDFEQGEKQLTFGYELQRRADELEKEAVEWIALNSRERFFAWIHLFDPHIPYDPPEPFASRYSGSLYDGEIAYTDAVIGRLLQSLSQHDLRENTLVILTSDHGESLGEHGEDYHGYFIYDATLRIPLIFSFPGYLPAGKAVPQQVRSIDVMPTILDCLNIDYRHIKEMEGVSLLSLMLGEKPIEVPPAYGETYYPHLHFGWGVLRALRSDGWKYIEAPRPELYDLKTDPRETVDLSTKQAERVQALKGKLEEIVTSAPGTESQPRDLDADTLRKLRSLGYVGISYDDDEKAEEERARIDPKDKIEEYIEFDRTLSSVNENIALGDYDAAIHDLKSLLALNDRSFDVHRLLGNAYRERKLYPSAVTQYQKAIELNPRFSDTYIDLAIAYTEMGRPNEALEIATKGAAIGPDSYFIRFNLASIYKEIGNHEQALKEFQAASALGGYNPKLRSNLADIYIKTGRFDEAIRELRELIQEGFNVVNAHYSLGIIYRLRGNYDDSIRHLELALDIDPLSAKTRSALMEVQSILEKRQQGYIRLRIIMVREKETAENIRAQLDEGVSFESIAKQYSLDPTASRGGDIGFVQKGSLVDALDQAAFRLDVAEVSEIIETKDSYFIIKRIE